MLKPYMNNQAVINLHKKYLHIVYFAMAVCTLFFTKTTFAEQYQLKLIADVTEFNQVSMMPYG